MLFTLINKVVNTDCSVSHNRTGIKAIDTFILHVCFHDTLFTAWMTHITRTWVRFLHNRHLLNELVTLVLNSTCISSYAFYILGGRFETFNILLDCSVNINKRWSVDIHCDLLSSFLTFLSHICTQYSTLTVVLCHLFHLCHQLPSLQASGRATTRPWACWRRNLWAWSPSPPMVFLTWTGPPRS